MPTISKIRITNANYENGAKKYLDDIFDFSGQNGIILLENGGGKTASVQIALQAVIPHTDLGVRKIAETLNLIEGPTHVAIEWILNEKPKRYALTAVTLYLDGAGKLSSLKFVNEYEEKSPHRISELPFTKRLSKDQKSPVGVREIKAYYAECEAAFMLAKQFDTIKAYRDYLEDNFQIIATEWDSILRINQNEGGADDFFKSIHTSIQLFEKIMIPMVESTLPGKGTEDFVQSFEKHREHFKQHKLLRQKISESQILNEKVGMLTALFQAEDEANEAVKAAKGILKFIYQETARKAGQIKADEEKAWDESVALGKREDELRRNFSAYAHVNLCKEEEITHRKYEEILEGVQKSYQEAETLERKKALIDQKNRREEIIRRKNKCTSLETQLNRLEKEEDAQNIELEMKEPGGQIKYIYTKRQEKLKQKLKDTLEAKERNEGREKEIAEIILEMQEGYAASKSLHGQSVGALKIKQEEIEKIAKAQIPDYPKTSIEETKRDWQKKVRENQAHLLQNEKEILTLSHEIEAESKYLEELREKIQQESIKLAGLTQWFLVQTEAEAEMKKALSQIRNTWHYWDIYEKRASIEDYLNQQISKLEDEIEALVQKERKIKQYEIDYHNKAFFTAEPEVESVLRKLGTTIGILESGAAFLDKVKGEEKWPLSDLAKAILSMSVITTTPYLEGVQSRFETLNDTLTKPVLILSDQEAYGLIKENRVPEAFHHFVTPKVWADALWPEDFLALKDKWHEIVAENDERKRQWQVALEAMKTFQKELRKHYQTYSIEVLSGKREEKLKISQQIGAWQYEKEDAGRKLEDKKRQTLNLKTKNEGLKEEERELSYRIMALQRCEEYQADSLRLKTLIKREKENFEQIALAMAEKKKEQEGAQKEIARLLQQQMVLKEQKAELKHDYYMKETQGYEALPAQDEALEALIFSFGQLQRKVKDMDGERAIYKEELRLLTKEIESQETLYETMKTVKKLTEEEICGFSFDVDYQRDLKQIEMALQKRRENLSFWEGEKEKWTEQKNKITWKRERHEEQHEKKWPGQYEISMAGENLQETLMQEERRLEEALKNNKKEIEGLQKEKMVAEHAMDALGIYDESHSFLKEDIQAIALEPQAVIDLNYQREKIIQEKIEHLRQKSKQREVERERLRAGKAQYKAFCLSHVGDMKLRERAISGMENASNLKEILVWREKVEYTLNRVVDLAEKQLIEQDRQLVIFVSHILNHVKMVTEDVRDIPKSTRIKQFDAWKTVYHFELPQWEETEAKLRIRDHLDQLIADLDGRQKEPKEGQEGIERKFIEKNLATATIFGVITQRAPIRMKCRKVKNDGTMSTNYFTWEDSCKWSGAEMWSKNMALLLGILNHIAEKRKVVCVRGQRNRVIMLDNPFGKASSDHVLNPVFYIADQLGFQLITLTAHGEGKYIRDYFSVVYSCKLVDTADGKSKVIHKEQIISKAFLIDKNRPQVEALEFRNKQQL